jgi:Type II secretion system (T2SS), protein E, N-terminal domain
MPSVACPATSFRSQGRDQDGRILFLQLTLLYVGGRGGILAVADIGAGTGEPCLAYVAGGEMGELLVHRDSVSEQQVTAVRATQWGYPAFAVAKHTIQATIHIPSTLIQIYSTIPLHYVAATNLLLVGFVYGVEYGLLCTIEQMTGCKTQPCFVTPTDFQAQMQQRNLLQEECGVTTSKEAKFESAHTPAEMAHILSSYGIDLGADEAIIGRCREYLWARLKHGAKTVDLLFKVG